MFHQMLFIYSFIFTVIVDKLKLVLSGSPRLLLANEGLSWGLALTGLVCRVPAGCGSLSAGIRVSSGTKMNHWRRGRVLGKDPDRAGSKWDGCQSKSECPAWWAASLRARFGDHSSNWNLLAKRSRDPFKLWCLHVNFL